MNLPNANRYVIITDDTVRDLYGNSLLKKLQSEGHKVDLLSVPTGEEAKSQEHKTELEHQMLELGCTRDTLIIALGGGVVGDLAGFTASTFMRGIPFVQIPTTLLAMVDSSIGGKTGINTPHGKNLIGTFWQPVDIILDAKYLETLPKEQLINGLIEAVKMFLTHDADSFNLVIENLDAILGNNLTILQSLIDRATKIKREVVKRDEREAGERALLNFGHTVGHALEKLSNFELMHGTAVALGILVEARMALLLGHLSEDNFAKIQTLFSRLQIDTKPLTEYKKDQILEAMQHDKKTADGEIKFVILKKPGEVFKDQDEWIHSLNPLFLEQALKYFKQE